MATSYPFLTHSLITYSVLLSLDLFCGSGMGCRGAPRYSARRTGTYEDVCFVWWVLELLWMGMYMVCSDLFRMICVLLLLAVCGIATRSDHRTIAGTGCLVSRKVESIGIGRTPIVVVLGYYRSYTINPLVASSELKTIHSRHTTRQKLQQLYNKPK
jgi:hypothetical protein